MTQKRPCDDELVNDVPLKHHRCHKVDDQSKTHLEFVPSEEASEKLHVSGEGGFVQNHLEDEEITTNGCTAVFPEINSNNNAGVPRSLSLSPWATCSNAEEDETLDMVVQLPLSQEYFSFTCPVRSPIHADDLYHLLLDYPPRKSVPIGPEYQADIPELSPQSPIRFIDHELNRICVAPQSNSESPPLDGGTVGGGRTQCSCEDTGSIRCVRQHIMEAREKLMATLGNDAFTELGFSEMGEVVAEKWTREEELLFHKVLYCNPVSSGKNFWNTLYTGFPSRTKMEIVSYYFNVFMLRKRAEQNRYDPINVDSDDDEWRLIGDDVYDAAEKTDEEDDSAIVSPLCHDDDEDDVDWRLNSLNERCEELINDKDLNCKVDVNLRYNDIHDGSCTSSDSGAPAQIPEENPDCSNEWRESMLEPCDAKAWNRYSSCAKDEEDFLPTCMIEEVFGHGTSDSQTNTL